MARPPLRTSLIRTYISFFLALLLAPLLLAVFVSYAASARVLARELEASAARTQERMAMNMDAAMQSFLATVELASGDATLLRQLRAPSAGRGGIPTILKAALGVSTTPMQVFLMDAQGRAWEMADLYGPVRAARIAAAIRAAPWYASLFRLERKPFWIGRQENCDSGNGGEHVLCVGRNVVEGSEYLGTLLFELPEYLFSRQMNNLKIDERTRVFLVDETGTVLVASEDSGRTAAPADLGPLMGRRESPFTAVIDGERWVVNRQPLAYFGLASVSMTPQSRIYAKLRVPRLVMTALVGFSVLCFLVSVLFVRQWFVRPLVDLSRLMGRVRARDLGARSTLSREDEIGILGAGFNDMLDELERLIAAIKEEEREKRDLQLAVLQAQVTPHFLYNTLNTIKWMAEIRNEKGIAKAVTYLARMLEYSAGEGAAFVTLEREMEYLDWYVHLSNLRYGNRISFRLLVPASLRRCRVPKLLLQPLVENSIIHGFSGRSGRGCIEVRARRMNGNLHITVSDDGKGMEPARAAALAAGGAAPTADAAAPVAGGREGIGLRNVTRRIETEFGPGYGVRVRSTVDKGTQVRLLMPLREERP